MNLQRLTRDIDQHEDCRLKAYQDSKGVWTIARGRNLQELRISQAVANQWFQEDLTNATLDAQAFPEYSYLDTDARRNAFIEMCYNLGAPRLRGFARMLMGIRLKDWEMVAKEALDSDWHRDVGHRAEVIAEMYRTGNFPK